MMRWRVVCALAEMIERFSPMSLFIRDDLPTLGLPTILTKPALKDDDTINDFTKVTCFLNVSGLLLQTI
jgi:hypothetical protein